GNTMRGHHSEFLAFLGLILAALCAPLHGARADEPLSLRPRYQVGDRYALALSTKTQTRVEAGAGRGGTNLRRDGAPRYSAQVEVLATDAAGQPIRERHENADLRYERTEGSRSLFEKGATFELTRRGDGRVEVRAGGERVSEKIEQIVGDLLARQAEYAV